MRFEGRIVPHTGDPNHSKGGLGNPWSFWLTSESLIEAVTRAQFRVEEFYTEADETAPEPLRQVSLVVQYGHWNTKVWLVATPRATLRPAGPARENVLTTRRCLTPIGRTIAVRGAAIVPRSLKRVLPSRLRLLARRLYMC